MKVNDQATRLLQNLTDGDSGAVDRLFPLVYRELRRLAAHYLRGERPDHTLQATALAHEVYLQLVGAPSIDWQGRTHFLAIAAHAARQVLIQHARGHQAQKRGGSRHRITLDEGMAIAEIREVDLLDLDQALTRLAELDERQARIVELRFFGGLNVEEVALALGVSERTVKGDWRVARAWLRNEINDPGHGVV